MNLISQQSKVRSVFVRFKTSEPIKVTPYVVKGHIMKYFPNERFVSFINGELHGVYLYPRIQVKILREQLCFFAVNEGVSAALSLTEKLEYLQIEDKKYEVVDKQILDQSEELFVVKSDQYYKYKFITPWVALNEKQLSQYEPMFSNERRNMLNLLLERNLDFVANDLGRFNDEKIEVRFVSSSLTPKTIEYSKFGSFKGFFTSNVIIPDYLGLGNSISKGLGTLVQLKEREPEADTEGKGTA
ncbi:MAG: CRISPR-associated endonuclease Cas6 [FCB group bacterium]|nr:CRISPR-associated endonuclease Cas6 [FCB group bacterium]